MKNKRSLILCLQQRISSYRIELFPNLSLASSDWHFHMFWQPRRKNISIITNIVEGLKKTSSFFSTLLLTTKKRPKKKTKKKKTREFPLQSNTNFQSSKYACLKYVLIETENQNFSAGCFRNTCKNTSFSCCQNQVWYSNLFFNFKQASHISLFV